jgi:hypothetical protein
MTLAKQQLIKLQAEKSCQVAFSTLRWLHSGAFLQRVDQYVSTYYGMMWYDIHLLTLNSHLFGGRIGGAGGLPW